MSVIINITSAYRTHPSVQAPSETPTRPMRPSGALAEDPVEFSSFGSALSRAMGESSFRVARVAALRAEIQDGVFETPERMNGTVERLLDVIG